MSVTPTGPPAPAPPAPAPPKPAQPAPAQPAPAALTLCADTRTTMIHVAQPSDLVIRPDTGPEAFHHLREGVFLKLMDLCTCCSAERLSGHSSVTLAVDDLVFVDTRLRVGETVIVRAQVNKAWGTSMEVGCTVYAEADSDSDDGDGDGGDASRRRICKAFFTFVSLGEDGKKIQLPKLAAITENNLRRAALAQERRKIRFRRKEIIARAAAKFVQLRGSSAKSGSDGHDSGNTGNTGSTTSTVAPADPATAAVVAAASAAASVGHTKPAPPLVTTEIVLPQHANHHGNTFGGQIMAWIAVAARVVSVRHAGSRMVVAQSIDDIFFVAPSRVGDRIEIKARVTRTFARTMEIQCEVHAHAVGGERRLINRAVWVMEAKNAGKHTKVLEAPTGEQKRASSETDWSLVQVDPTISEEASIAFAQALGRRALRIDRWSLGSGHNLDPSWAWPVDDSDFHWEDLAARSVSDLLGAFWKGGASPTGNAWGLLEAASNDNTKLYMRQSGGMVVVKAVSTLRFTAGAVTEETVPKTSKKHRTERSGGLFGLFRRKPTKAAAAAVPAATDREWDDSKTHIGRVFAALCDNTRRREWDVMAEEGTKTIHVLDATNDVTRLVFRRPDGALSDFLLLRSWRADEARSRYVIANHSVRADHFLVSPPEKECTRGVVGSSGWVMERGKDPTNEVRLSYLVTLAASGIKALGNAALDVIGGQSKVICMNMDAIARILGAELVSAT